MSACAISVFIPLVLEEITHSVGKIDGTDQKCPDRSAEGSEKVSCVVDFGPWKTTTVGFALYITAISVGLQAITFISMGSLADYGRYKKLFLQIFAVAGATSALLFFVVPAGNYAFAGALAIIGNICFGAANVFYNAYLPLLVNNHPEVLDAKRRIFSHHSSNETSASDIQLRPMKSDSAEDVDLSDQDIHDHNKMQEYLDVSARLGNQISSKGFGIGYLGGVILLLISAAVVSLMGQTTYSKQVAAGLNGVWWLFFSTYTWRTLKDRPGPPLPANENFLFLSWKKVFTTIRQYKRLPNAFLNIFCFFLYSDGSNTIVSVAVLFGQVQLKLQATDLIAIAIIIPFCAFLGNFFWLWFSQRMGWSTQKTLLIILTLLCLIPLYGTLGLLFPLFRTRPEFYAIGAFFGFCLGSWSSFSRVMMSDLIPSGCESEFFSLYEITNKGSSWVGPLVVGIISNATNDLRYSFIFILAMIAIPLPLLYMVDPIKGKEEAKQYEIEEKLRNKV
ncbi:autophagy-related protein 22-like protein [Paraphysoderma sedebokerense]|nr:autophagy-related protein 22-like protein [Paraphysoderma sedebokerense]